MTVFVAVLVGLTLVVLAVVLLPLFRGDTAAPERAVFDRAVFRDQLRELERDVARGMIGPAEAAAARLEIQRRLLAREGPAAAPASPGRNPALALALAVLVAGGAGSFYVLSGAPGMPSAPPRPAPVDEAQAGMLRGADELEARLAAEPGNADGWLLLARTAGRLGQWERSAAAYAKAAALVPPTPDMLAAQGEAMVLAARGIVTEAAQERFAAVLAARPDDPVARFYRAVADAQAGRNAEAIAAWQKLAGELPAASPIREEIARRIAAAARQAGIAVPALPPPSAAPDAPAQGPAVAAEGSQEMIRGMVARLAARLEAEPNDADGWLRLGRSYGVLGEREKSSEAYARAAALRPDDLAIPLAEAQGLLEGLPPQAPFPPRALELLRRVAAADPNQPSALWHLGVEAAKRNAMGEAAGYWERLLKQLPADSDDATMVRSALEAVKRR